MSKLSLSVEPLRKVKPSATTTSVLSRARLTDVSLAVPDDLTQDDWEEMGRLLGQAERSVQWWLGDWRLSGERLYGSLAEQSEAAGVDYDTLNAARWVAERIEVVRRRTTLSWSHHREVAALPADEQDAWLTRAESEGWSRNELRKQLVRAPRSPADTPLLPAGVYSTIVADPPWDVLTGPDWGSGGPARPLLYPTMSVEAIAALPVKDLAADDAHLYLWTINAYLTEAYEIAESWGFTPSTLLTWCKRPHGIGLGGTYVLTTEHVLFARRGALAAQERVDTTWFDWPRRDHSVKPDEFFDMVEEVSPGPHLELFARRPRSGWTVWGDEAPDEAAS